MKEQVLEMKKELEELKEESFALEMLRDYKKLIKKIINTFLTIIIVILFFWAITGAYLIYVLNDIGVIEETVDVTQESGNNGNNNFINGDSNEVNN